MAPGERNGTVRAFRFGDYVLYAGGKGLFRGGQWVALRKRPYEVLLYLVSHSGQVVSREELLAEVWGESRDLNVVEQCIHDLRSRLGDQPRSPRFIQTVHGVGYRFLPEVELAEAEPGQGGVLDSAVLTEPERGKPAVSRRIWIWGIFAVLAGAGVLLFAPSVGPRPGSMPEVARLIIAGPVIQAHDSTGHIVWTHALREPAMTLTPDETKRRVWFLGGKSTGRPERFLVAVPRADGPAEAFAHRLLCFSASGALLWEYRPQSRLEFPSRTFDGGWEIQKVVPAGGTTWIAVKHEIWWPSFLIRLHDGTPETVFVQSGVITDVALMQATGGEMLVIAGVNNEYEMAAVAVLKAPFQPAVSPQGDSSPYRCLNCEPAAARWYALLPSTDVARAAGQPYSVASAVRFHGSSLEVEVMEAGQEHSFYQFGLDLAPAGYAVSDGYPRLHEALFLQGLLRHRASECPELIRPRTIRVFRDGAWSALQIRRTGDSQPLARRD